MLCWLWEGSDWCGSERSIDSDTTGSLADFVVPDDEIVLESDQLLSSDESQHENNSQTKPRVRSLAAQRAIACSRELQNELLSPSDWSCATAHGNPKSACRVYLLHTLQDLRSTLHDILSCLPDPQLVASMKCDCHEKPAHPCVCRGGQGCQSSHTEFSSSLENGIESLSSDRKDSIESEDDSVNPIRFTRRRMKRRIEDDEA